MQEKICKLSVCRLVRIEICGVEKTKSSRKSIFRSAIYLETLITCSGFAVGKMLVPPMDSWNIDKGSSLEDVIGDIATSADRLKMAPDE